MDSRNGFHVVSKTTFQFQLPHHQHNSNSSVRCTTHGWSEIYFFIFIKIHFIVIISLFIAFESSTSSSTSYSNSVSQSVAYSADLLGFFDSGPRPSLVQIYGLGIWGRLKLKELFCHLQRTDPTLGAFRWLISSGHCVRDE